MTQTDHKLESILVKAREFESLSTDEILFLLHLKDAFQVEALFKTARNLRSRFFNNKVFLYGFLYTSTFCRNDCRFCFFRRSNAKSRRYRKEKSEILSTAIRLAGSGVHLIDLTMGEDPVYLDSDGDGFDRWIDLVASVRQATGLPLMVSPGVIPENIFPRLAEAGVVWYACYQETHQPDLFESLRPGQNYRQRLETKQKAHGMGLLIEEGLLCGVGETAGDIADSIEVMRRLNADQVRVMQFVPQPGTPMENQIPPDSQQELLISAVLRLVFPDRLIPASLDVEGLSGLKKRLNAGANVITSIVPPGGDLAGVARHALDIEEGRRTVSLVKRVLHDCGLRASSVDEYMTWIDDRRNEIKSHRLNKKAEVCGSV